VVVVLLLVSTALWIPWLTCPLLLLLLLLLLQV
jgi:hypothetical protein